MPPSKRVGTIAEKLAAARDICRCVEAQDVPASDERGTGVPNSKTLRDGSSHWPRSRRNRARRQTFKARSAASLRRQLLKRLNGLYPCVLRSYFFRMNLALAFSESARSHQQRPA